MCRVFDRDLVGAPELLGTVTVQLPARVEDFHGMDDPLDQWQALEMPPNHQLLGGPGSLHLRLSYGLMVRPCMCVCVCTLSRSLRRPTRQCVSRPDVSYTVLPSQAFLPIGWWTAPGDGTPAR
jgi:hypothetical protein